MRSWWRRPASPRTVLYDWRERLPSVDEHVSFTADFHMTATGPRSLRAGESGAEDQPGADIPAWVWPIVNAVQQQTESVTRTVSVLRRGTAQHQVNMHWARVLPWRDDDGAALTWVTVALSVDPDDHHAAVRLQQAHRETALDSEERRRIAATMGFLRQECFDNPASARLFLMLNRTTRLGVFPNADQADAIVTQVNDWHPDTLWVRLAKILAPLLTTMTPLQIDSLLRLLQSVLHTHGDQDAELHLQQLRAGGTGPLS
jgi:hypothetical protein